MIRFDISLTPEWSKPPEPILLAKNEVHVWRVDLNLSPDRLKELSVLLSQDELQRARRFHFEKHQRRFIVHRAYLRLILSRYLDQKPSQFLFSYNAYGKPSLVKESNKEDLRFNLSHSGEIALYAVAQAKEIGIDVEQLREVTDAENIARRYFTESELAFLLAASNEQKNEAFFQLWTYKEAYIKAKGMGFSFPLNQFDVNTMGGHWTLRQFKPADGHLAAMVVEGKEGLTPNFLSRIRFFIPD